LKAQLTSRERDFARQRIHEQLIPERPKTPDNFTVLGLKFGFYITWSQVDSADGYEIAVMTGNDLANPELLIDVPGQATMQKTYTVGDVAIARTFTVHSYKNSVNGERLFSEFYYPFASATSKVDGGAADATPVSPPSPAPSPDSGESSGDPGGIGKTGESIEIA
jgi:hypothetical protein